MQTFGAVASRSHPWRPVFRLHPHLACRLPYRFPRGRFTRLLRVCGPAPWLPYRFPRGRLGVGVTAFRQQPWLPYRFPKDFTDTVRLLASLSKFVIVDITNPRSAPLELQATVPDTMVPFVPILQQGEEPFSMFVD